ncbi:genetic suppressor element 1 isoform X3 [Pelodiscus sinensis]|uniref:genetic suppressor element 1 isoform X3 n=1 Tax=Pelodiscus sinensis TaxID=13735 RepID=UPI003F6C3733
MSDRPAPGKDAPVSRKQRLMAAFSAGPEPPPPPALCCFVCGGALGRGQALKLQVKAPRERQPFFPFLQHQEPAPGAQEVSAEGCALVCAVCRCFLAEQWEAFERSRTPLEKRMYWLKRPHQCEAAPGAARGGPEWNLAYALGEQRRGSGSSPPAEEEDEEDPGAGGGDSDLSSLSDTDQLSEPEPSARTPEPPSHAAGLPLLRPGAANGAAERPGPGAPMGSRPRPPPPALGEPPVPQDNGLAAGRRRRRRPWPDEAPSSSWRGGQGAAAKPDAGRGAASSRAPEPVPGDGDLIGKRAPAYSSSEESEINITSDEEGQGACPAPSRLEHAHTLAVPRPPWAAAPPPLGTLCYICGSPLSLAGQHQIHVQKQEKSSKAPFFPFLWLHSPPPGALPISPVGSTLVCACCFSSLMQQWQSFEVAGVPVLQRLYVVPLEASVVGLPPKGRRAQKEEGAPGPPQEACYLCGEDCGQEARLVSAKITNGTAKNAMHFPFLSHLPCPPHAKGLSKHGEVHSCRKCYGVLQDLWAMYRACRNEELIASVHSFLGRYHQVFSTGEPSGTARRPPATSGPASVCYICGAELGAGKEFQLSVNPPGRFGEKEPFFPFLTVYPPAPRARPADSTGLVATCVLCYHDLLGQWLQHESRTPHQPSSAWSRQYKVETFVCFFCRQERKRCLGLKAVQVARLPVFLYSLRVANSLLVDDGKQLTIGACAECGAVVLAGKNVTPPDFLAGTPPAGLPKALSSSLETPAVKPAAGEPRQRPAGSGENPGARNGAAQESGLDRGQRPGVDVEGADQGATSMSHEPKSPSLGMLSTATRNTATVSPLTPSPLNGALVPNGSPAGNSSLSVPPAPSSSFAAALRKLAKQAEEPRGSSISSESSPVSSPATNHSSPASTPKRGPMGPIIVPPGGHSVPSTPPVVTIAPTKTVNGVWRSEGRQRQESWDSERAAAIPAVLQGRWAGGDVKDGPVRIAPSSRRAHAVFSARPQQEAGSRGSSSSRERLMAEPPLSQEKAGGPAVPSHLLGTPYSFGIPPTAVVQDSRFPPLNSLQRPVHHVVPPSAVTEDYLRSFRPYHTAEELRMSSLPPISLDPATAAAYYHPGYLAHHPFPHPAFRMDDSYCLSALRSPFYPIPTPGSLPPLHPSAMHLHLSGVRYPTELPHSSLSALQSERMSSLTAERLQLDEELRQREREREREREKEREREREADREREKEREREREKELEREREKERERELERQRERAREKELNLAKAMESPFLPVAELHGLRSHPAEERVKPAEQLTPTRPEKPKDATIPTPKAVQHPLHQPPASHHPVPSLISNHSVFPLAGSSAATALLIQRTNEEEKWLARQRRLRQEKEDRQSQVSEFRQQVLEQHLEIGRPPNQPEAEHRAENSRSGPNRHEPSARDQPQHFGGPPPLISPKPQHHPVPTSLWNPVSLLENNMEPRRIQENHSLHAQYEPSRQAIPLVKVERVFCPEKLEEGARKREALDKYQPARESGASEHGGFSHGPFLAELEKSTQTILNQQRASLSQTGQFAEVSLPSKPSSPYRHPLPRAHDPMYVYDEFLQQHRKLVSKLDLEERRRREAREKGYYYDLDDSYDESDEEEVRAHLRCVAEQPPLKLDTSSEKLEFLQLFGLTTQQQKEELLTQKRRKRRRMLRERSPSPPTVQNKRRTPSPRLPLSTRYSADEMNNSPNFEEKKRFLTIFNLTHISAEKRKDKEKLVEMLHAMKQKSATAAVVVKSSPRDSPTLTAAELQVQQPPVESDRPVGITASSPDTQKTAEPSRLEQLRPQEPQRAKEPAPVSAEKPRLNDGHTGKKSLSIFNYVRGPLPKDIPVPLSHSMNGKNKPWEPFIAEEFAHQFHESVLQSTQKALQKHKGSATALTAEQNHKIDTSIHYNIPELQTSSRVQLPQQNGQQDTPLARRGLITPEQDKDSDSEGEDEEEEDEEEEEYPRPKWQGIEAIFEAYQEHIEEQNLERQVLQTQCRRLEAQHYSLSLTAEQLSHSMAELRNQKQKIVSERERLQAELDHLRKCLALPAMQWSRGYFKGYPR